MSVHGPLIFVLLIDKCVESTHVSKPVSTLTVHTVHREEMDGGEQEKKRFIRLPSYPYSLVFQQKMLSTLKLNTKGIINTFLGKLPTYPSPKPTLTLTSHLGQNVGLGKG